MMRKLFLSYAMLLAANSFAQKGIMGLVNAENNFATHSIVHSTREAFLAFMDSSSIVFDNGKPANGIKIWNARKINAGKLNWRPAYGEISLSDDFGYTTGPWTYRMPGVDTVIAKGFYITVWHINAGRKWKFLVDLGVDNAPEHMDSAYLSIDAFKSSVKIPDTASFIKSEKDFIRLFNKNNKAAYQKYLSDQSILNRNAHLQALNKDDQRAIINATPSSIQYTINGWMLSPGRDMACVYGSTVLNNKHDNYLRIWRHEKDGWKIAVEVLHH